MPTLGCAKPVDNVGEKRFLIGYAAELQNASFEATVAQSRGASIDQEGPLVHGHFTRALLAALYGGAAQATGGVTANGLKEYLEREVPRIAREHEHDQRAVVQSNFGQDAQPVFGSAQPLANFRISFSPARHGQIRLEAPDLRSIRSGDASTGPWDVSLAQGLHRLVELESGDELIIRFRPSDGTTHVVF
jgi:hypothetical protein